MSVYVCNRTEVTFEDGYNGVRYIMEPGETIAMPAEAAAHIFGYGQDDRTKAFVRLGWMQSSADRADAEQKLSGFVFKEQEPEQIPDLASESASPRRRTRLEPNPL